MAIFLQAESKPIVMFKNYLLTAFRNFKRNKLYTTINVFGLGLGIACAALIFSLIKYNLTFDNFHPKSGRIFRITTELNIGEKKYIKGVPSPLAAAFRSDYPYAEKIASVYNSTQQLVSVKDASGDKKFEEDVAFAEPSFFELFDFPLVKGNQRTILTDPRSAIITEKLARKYFAGSDPIGQTIRVANTLDFTVTGILKDLPVNTDFTQQIYLPFVSLKVLQPWVVTSEWRNVNNDMQCFLRLKPGVSSADVNKIFPSFSLKYYANKDAKEWQFQLQPLADIHLNTDYGAFFGKDSLIALGCIGLFLVLAACINFINLATAQAISRSKEIGVRKVLGSTRPQLFWQFIVETALISILALVAALVISEMAMPAVNQLFNTQIQIDLINDPYLLIFLMVLLVFMIFSSGFYPGLVLAGIQPVLALKGKISHSSSGSVSLRKGLVITQFAISQLLIIGTIVIVNQMNYAQQASMGFAKNGIMMLPVPDNQPAKIRTVKEQLLKIAGVNDLTFCYAPPAQERASASRIKFGSRPENEKFSISCRYADNSYASFFGIGILAGRNIKPADTVKEFLINAATVKMLGLKSNEDALGKTAVINGYTGTIVGVMKDFHNKSFHSAIEPLALTSFHVWYGQCALKIDMQNMKSTLSQVESVWKQAFPNSLYKQDFLDDRIAKLYETDNVMMKLIQIFTFIAVFIGCLSLYGLVSFMAAQKRKEVAVRKVLGASVESIVFLFGKEFGRLMLIAFMIAAPFGWWVMHRWLDNFAYRIDIGGGVFLLALVITFSIVALTVGYKSVRTALADPARSLKSE